LTQGSLVVGLAGKAAAGKNTLLQVFLGRGFVVIDADQLGHEALDACSSALVDRFGTNERKALGRIVFRDGKALADLEAISHPYIHSRILQILGTLQGKPAVINGALLSRLKLGTILDAVIWVKAPLLARLKRAKARDDRNWRFVVRRAWVQRKLSAQDFGADVDIHSVENRASPEQARANLERILDRLPHFPERKP
jgi:dephospho-CoA kinase